MIENLVIYFDENFDHIDESKAEYNFVRTDYKLINLATELEYMFC